MYYQLQVLIFRLATAYLTSLASVSDFGKGSIGQTESIDVRHQEPRRAKDSDSASRRYLALKVPGVGPGDGRWLGWVVGR